MKMCPAYCFIFMQTKFIFIWKVLYKDSIWNEAPGNTEMANWAA